MKEKKGVKLDTELDADDLKELVERFKALVQKETGQGLPRGPVGAAQGAINAVFDSWNNPRAIRYRQINDIPGDWGTAVNVQSMVFGNMGETSRHRRGLHPRPLHRREGLLRRVPHQRPGRGRGGGHPHARADRRRWRQQMPEVYKRADATIFERLEKHYKDMQDIEFTIEEGKLYMLQTRNGKRTARPRCKIAVDMVKEGLIDEKTGATARRSGAAGPAAAPDVQPEGRKPRRARQGHAGLARAPPWASGRSPPTTPRRGRQRART